jgi:serine/threonine protein kinase
MAGPQTENRVVADRYALRSILGRGGTGVVWRGEDTLLERPVAIKTVELPVTLPDDELEPTRQRVLREARAAARLSHPSAVTVYDVVEEHDRVYLVMELVEAPTLSEVVVREGPLDPAAAARLGLNLLEPLEAAHAEGIVHRDVKPSNVMVLDSGVKLADFGIASVKSDPSLTRTGMLLGSPPYMAPEQAEGAPSDDATDLWGLGATLYFAVEGHPPFGPGDPLPTLMSVVNEDPRPVRRAGRLAPVLDALLTKDPARRPTAAEAHSLLE